MDTELRRPYASTATAADTVESARSAVSWPAIFAGGLAAAALTLILAAFGAGAGLSTLSPWSGAPSATAFKLGAGLYLLVTAVLSSAVGGYLAGRLRTRWANAHTREVFFRDTAHGMLTWAFATVLTLTLLSAPVGALLGGASNALQGASQEGGVLDTAVDTLLRPAPGTALSTADRVVWRGEAQRVFAAAFQPGANLNDADRAYLTRIVAASAGVNEPEAQRRVSDAIASVKQAADAMRKFAAQLSLWLAASLLLGAFSASLAAIEGGGLRDGTWHYKV